MTIVLGIDHGNGYVKGFSAFNSFVFPSVLARPEDFTQVIVKSDKNELYTFTSTKSDGEEFKWGADVLKAKNFLPTGTRENRYSQDTYRLLSEFAMALLLPEGDSFSDVTVVTGCPSNELNTEMEEDLRRAYIGLHAVTIDGKTKMFKVNHVEIVPQPLGTVLSRYLDEEGFVKDEDFETDYIGIIDIGSGTLDIDGIHDLGRVNGDFDTFDYGMGSALTKIAAYVKSKVPSATVRPEDVGQQIANDFYKISKQSVVDIAQIKEETFRKLAKSIGTTVRNRWKSLSKFDRVMLTGGGALALKPYLEKEFPGVEIVDSGQTANAEGFYRYGLTLVAEES
jgi:plasmid segregation protein ParM